MIVSLCQCIFATHSQQSVYVLDSIYLGKYPAPVITQALIKLGAQQTHYQDLCNYIWVAFILRVMPETDT